MITFAILFWTSWALIIYTYAIFPVLLSILSSQFGDKGTADSTEVVEAPRVSMVVAAYNEEAVIQAKLDNCWEIDYPKDKFHVYIGSDGSSDATATILQACRNPQLSAETFSQRRGKISVLNDLVRLTSNDTEILVMTDASTLFAPDAVRKLVRQFNDPRVGCVTGELSIEQKGDVSGEGLYLKYERWIKRCEGKLGCVIGCVGAIFAVRRKLYRPLPPATIVEDFVLCLRVLEQGYRAVSEPEARAVDPACATTKGEMTRKIRIGAGGFQAIGMTWPLLGPKFGFCAFAYWGHKVLRWLVPCFFITGFVANLLMVIALNPSVFYWITLALQCIGGVIACVTYRLPPGRKAPRWAQPIGYFYLMNYGLFRGLLRFLLGTQKVTWERAEAADEPASVLTMS